MSFVQRLRLTDTLFYTRINAEVRYTHFRLESWMTITSDPSFIWHKSVAPMICDKCWKTFTLNCFYSKLTGLNVKRQHDNRKTHGRENFKFDFSTPEDKKKCFQRPSYTRRHNRYASTRCTSLMWHRNKKVVAEMNVFVVVFITHLGRATAPRKNNSSTRWKRVFSFKPRPNYPRWSPRYIPQGWIGPIADLRVKTHVLAGNRILVLQPIPHLLCWESLHYKPWLHATR